MYCSGLLLTQLSKSSESTRNTNSCYQEKDDRHRCLTPQSWARRDIPFLKNGGENEVVVVAKK